MVRLRFNPTARDAQVASAKIDDVEAMMDEYIREIIEFVKLNRANTKLQLRDGSQATKHGV
jgi:hypothetical protein